MTTRFWGSRTLYPLALSTYDCTYHPEGTVLTGNYHTTGRITKSGEDDLGRFCLGKPPRAERRGDMRPGWYRCYRNLGPHTVYTTQYTALRVRGVENPNLRKKVFHDILSLTLIIPGSLTWCVADMRTLSLKCYELHLQSIVI